MLFDGRELVGQPAGLVVFLVGLAEANGGLLFLYAVEHLHIFPLDLLDLLFTVGVVKGSHMVKGACMVLRTPSFGQRRFLAAVILGNFLK